MAAINWTFIALLIIGFFALSGFLKGWWKEAITTFFLGILVFFQLVPSAAQLFIDSINWVISLIWRIIPNVVFEFIYSIFGWGSGTPDVAPQVDAGSSQTWLIMLILFIGLAVLVGRLVLPGAGRNAAVYRSYVVTCSGAIFGALLGAVNGWLIISLIKAYLQGNNLPGSGGEMSALGMASAPPADDVVIQAVNVPNATIMDSFLPWLFMGIGVLVIIAAIKTRVGVYEDDGFRQLDYKAPPGHRKIRMSS
jgi:hypothetical protein